MPSRLKQFGKMVSIPTKRKIHGIVLTFIVMGIVLAVSGLKPSQKKVYHAVGGASWYGKKFQGKKTASGQKFNMYEMSGAHRTLPFNTWVTVKNLKNNKEVKVKIIDRGPFAKDRIIDVSYAAAKKLDMLHSGTARVEITANLD